VLSGIGTNAQGQKYVQISVQDTDDGLKTVIVTTLTNATAQVGNYQSGITRVPTSVQIFDRTTGPVVVTATRIVQSSASQVALQVVDEAGNVTSCDPVLATLTARHGQLGWQVFTDLSEAESKLQISNGDPGLRRVLVVVNGRRFALDGLRPNEIRTLDLARAMKPGDGNTVVLRSSGPSGGSADVLIWDGLGSPPPAQSFRQRPLKAGPEEGSDADDALLDWLAGP